MAKKSVEKKQFSIGQMASLIDKLSEETKLIIENDAEGCEFISTGVHILDALFSKSILHGGVPVDMISILAGPPATGKSYILYNVAREAQLKNYYIIFIDTEHSINLKTLSDFGIDSRPDKLKLISSNKVEDLKFFLVKFLMDMKAQKEAGLELPKVMIMLDSIGQLASEKEVTDAQEGKGKSDMTRAKSIKQLFRIINSDLGYLKIPLLATNHVYEEMGLFPTKVMSGGSGISYSASCIVFLSTAKLKNGSEDEMDLNASGAIITAQAKKNRLSRPKKVKFEIDFGKGTNKFKGLDFFCNSATFDKVGIAKGKKVERSDGTIGIENGGIKWYVRHLDKYFFEKTLFTSEVFTQEILEALEPIIYKYFSYSSYDEQQAALNKMDSESDDEDVFDDTDNDFDSIDSDSLFE
jgi:RecA/RadA recombinase